MKADATLARLVALSALLKRYARVVALVMLSSTKDALSASEPDVSLAMEILRNAPNAMEAITFPMECASLVPVAAPVAIVTENAMCAEVFTLRIRMVDVLLAPPIVLHAQMERVACTVTQASIMMLKKVNALYVLLIALTS